MASHVAEMQYEEMVMIRRTRRRFLADMHERRPLRIKELPKTPVPKARHRLPAVVHGTCAVRSRKIRSLQKPCMTDIYLQFLCAHCGLYLTERVLQLPQVRECLHDVEGIEGREGADRDRVVEVIREQSVGGAAISSKDAGVDGMRG
eukprot:COSAG05_NODE_127_length_17241_cov_7.514817_12_plen_147_part_00